MNSTAQRVLIISKDQTLLKNETGFGDTLERHLFYANRLKYYSPNSEIFIIAYSSSRQIQQELFIKDGVSIVGTKSKHRIFFIIDAYKAAKKIIDKGWIPTIITTQEPYEDGHLGLYLAKKYHAKFIPQLHFDLFSKDWLKENSLNYFKRILAPMVLKRSDAIRVVSHAQKNKIADKFNISLGNIHVIPVGVSFLPTMKTKLQCKSEISERLVNQKVVLFVGRLCQQKNMMLWIDVAKNIVKKEKNINFIIAGDGILDEDIRLHVKQSGLMDNFIFLGNVPYDKLPDVYGAADVFLLTSHYEGFGRVIVEAGLSGVPSVSTICTGPEDIIIDGETGYLCQIGNSECLVKGVLNLIKSNNKKEFSLKSKAHVSKLFDRKNLADMLIKMWLN
jgi:glycosyltransferase involved in cell wall biosynthesis